MNELICFSVRMTAQWQQMTQNKGSFDRNLKLLVSKNMSEIRWTFFRKQARMRYVLGMI